MYRNVQPPFPSPRGVANPPHLYRSILLYGTGSARTYFEANAGITLSDFVKTGVYLSAALEGNGYVDRAHELSEIGITPAIRETALAKLAISHTDARARAAR